MNGILSCLLSLPPRGAWIEILNLQSMNGIRCLSLPPRGAWIEMSSTDVMASGMAVAPPTGSVDRNQILFPLFCACLRRSPHGERG